MKRTLHPLRRLGAALLALTVSASLMLPAAASEALGEDLSAKNTVLHQGTALSRNVFWSTSYSDLRTENLITYSPSSAVTPIVTFGESLTQCRSVSTAARKFRQLWQPQRYGTLPRAFSAGAVRKRQSPRTNSTRFRSLS